MFSLRGDPGFGVGGLSVGERVWFDRMWAGIDRSSAGLVAVAERDNSYHFGRDVYQFSHALLLGLRSTGDLRFLDEVDVVMEALRGELRDGWCGGVEGSVYVNVRYGEVAEPDGFVNFRWRADTSVDTGDRDYCRDTGDLDETLTHGHLAMVMYAYHVNRDLVSPGGVDYGERADFWFDYLRNHFEAKWRARSGVAWPEMDFIDLKFGHTYHVFALYYYFMGKRLESVGDADAVAYLDKVAALTDAMFEQPYVPGKQGGGFVGTSGAYGDAVVYSVSAPGNGTLSAGSVSLQALPMTYARYMLSAILTLRLEGFARWDDAIMVRLSNGITSFVLDVPSVTSSKDTFAAGNSGGEVVEGMPPTTYRPRFTVRGYGYTSIPGLAVWDASGRIEAVSLQAYAALQGDLDRPDSVHIPSSMLFVESATARELGVTAGR